MNIKMILTDLDHTLLPMLLRRLKMWQIVSHCQMMRMVWQIWILPVFLFLLPMKFVVFYITAQIFPSRYS